VAVKSGVYLYALGPNFETPGPEVRMFAQWGGDGGGHVHRGRNVWPANHCGLKVRGAVADHQFGGRDLAAMY